jgi:TRAP-type C4-dicarboxylate transport system substrate-binding protein
MRSHLKTGILAGALALGVSTAAFAQADPEKQAAYKAALEAKLQKPFMQNAAWQTDYDKARAKAKESGKLLFTYFTRTYLP